MEEETNEESSSDEEILEGTVQKDRKGANPSSSLPLKKNSIKTDQFTRWKSTCFILGNETLFRVGNVGMTAYMQLFYVERYHIDQATVALLLAVLSATGNLLPMVGAMISDTYLGKYKTILAGSSLSLLGMLGITLNAYLPTIRPPKCDNEQQIGTNCLWPTHTQVASVIMSHAIVAIGGAGIKACSLPFSADQFSVVSNEPKKGVRKFFKCYYGIYVVVSLITSTFLLVLKIYSWKLGLLLPLLCMSVGFGLFLMGRRGYVHVRTEKRAIVSIIEVFVVAFKKRNLEMPVCREVDSDLYNPSSRVAIVSKLPGFRQFRFLQKAAIIADSDLNQDGSLTGSWRLCSLEQIEEVKCLIRIIPIWATSIISVTCMFLHGAFVVQQASKMNRHITEEFVIPPGCVSAVAWLGFACLLSIYQCLLVPVIEKQTEVERGLTLLQRVGVGNAFNVVSVFCAAVVERQRRGSVIELEEVSPISAFWLTIPIMMMCFYEVFGLVGMIEFYNRQFPEHIRSVGNSVNYLTIAVAHSVGSLLMKAVKKESLHFEGHAWLNGSVNGERLDNFYWILFGLAAFNFIFFLLCSSRYHYKPDA